ncbi:MAG: dihydropteroate synthase [Oscillospiraceae bacterium]|nr:dihydropteroate synthase [Oscillospiraceae bacterium]MCL2279111.1 dihydropteroate synthase [Oscillospiraceae bacterium]
MIIIAEKLNGSIPSCGKAIAARDEEYIKDLAKRQADAGADFIDCCASVENGETETLKWMIDAIQSVTDCPISVDSPDVSAIIDAMQYCKKPGLFNSVSCEGNKLELAFPILAKPENKDWHVMALLCGDDGIPKTAAERIEIFEKIMAEAKRHGIEDKRIHIDPLVEMLCTKEDGEGVSLILEVMGHIKKTHPNVHISGAISNVSYNLPARRLINQAFTVLTINAGMTSVVLDPLSADLRGMILATEALLGNDDYCLEYIGAYREGLFA